jgi:hypothetical protein
LATSGQVLDMAAAMALKTSGVPLKLGLSSASMSPVDDSICGIVHAGSRSHPHIVLACCGLMLDCAAGGDGGAGAAVGSGASDARLGPLTTGSGQKCSPPPPWKFLHAGWGELAVQQHHSPVKSGGRCGGTTVGILVGQYARDAAVWITRYA